MSKPYFIVPGETANISVYIRDREGVPVVVNDATKYTSRRLLLVTDDEVLAAYSLPTTGSDLALPAPSLLAHPSLLELSGANAPQPGVTIEWPPKEVRYRLEVVWVDATLGTQLYEGVLGWVGPNPVI